MSINIIREWSWTQSHRVAGSLWLSSGSDQFLPLIALLLSMFVTTGETLVFGLAQRVLRAAASVVASEDDAGAGVLAATVVRMLRADDGERRQRQMRVPMNGLNIGLTSPEAHR